MTEPAAQRESIQPATERIREEFARQLANSLHPAAGLSIFVDGEEALSLVGGNVPVSPLFRVFSCGKPLAAAVLWRLHDRGLVDWDEPVATYWPEFGGRGKNAITLRHVLTHTAGIPDHEALPWRDYVDWGRIVGFLEDLEPLYEPGVAIEYHSLTFGWLVGEVASRITGMTFEEAFQEEVAEPLGLQDTSFSLEPSEHQRVVPLKSMPGFEDPAIPFQFDLMLEHRVVAPGGSCLSTASDVARFHSVLAAGGAVNGTDWLRPDTVREVTSLHAEGIDRSSGDNRRVRVGLGVFLPAGEPNKFGVAEGSPVFGHGGIGSCFSWGDRESRVAAAYVTSGLQPKEINDERHIAMTRLVRAAFGDGE